MMWALLWTHEERFGRLRERHHFWIESVEDYHPDGVDVRLGNDQSTLVERVPYRELQVTRIG